MPIAAINPLHAAASRTPSQPRSPAPPPPAAEMPDAPKPVTPANAAVHIMKVPSSRVVEAFVSLQRAIGMQARTEAPALAPQASAPRVLPAPAPRPQIDLEA